MAGPESYKLFKTLLLLFGFFQFGRPQTFLSLSENNCAANNPLFPDNLSCNNAPADGTDCFLRSELCDGQLDCSSGVDEGNAASPNVVLTSLECK